MKTPPRSGAFPEVSLVEVLDYYARSGQTAAVSISVPRPSGGEATGAFFVEAGAVVDALFDGREGPEAVRQALRIQLGKYQVELGSRSARHTVNETWETLAAAAAAPEKPAPPKLYPVDGGARPTPPPAPLPRLTTHRAVASNGAAASVSSAHSGAHRSPPRDLGVRATTGPGTAAAAAVAPPPPLPPNAGLTASGPRPLHTSGPTTSPFSGPHSVAARGQPAVGTAPFSSVRGERKNRLLPPGAMLAIAAVFILGIGLAFGVAYLRNHSGAPAEAAAVSAKPAVAPVAPGPAPAVAGVSDSEISLGMAAPLTGVSKELGRQMRLGLDVAFARANANGGVNGRKVKLFALDDGYEPSRTKDVMRELAEQRGVFSFVGNVGTPTAAVAVPYALERKMLFFGPFTGASLLRKEPPDRYVFNYRASYAEETAAIVRYLVEVRHIKPEQIAVFAQDDSYGDAGFQGVTKGLRQLKRNTPVLKVTYTRNTADVSDAVARVLDRRANVAAVVMVATYRPAARFIEKVREQRPGMIFTNVSFVGSQALAEELLQLGPQYAQGVIITQVVPLPTGQSTVGMRYREALASFAPEEKPDFISLEGYVTGNLLLEGLRLTGRNVTTDGLVDALESIHGLDLGLGVPLSFGLSEHQASHKVWGTVLDGNGAFQQLELE